MCVFFEAQTETDNLSLFKRPVLLWFNIYLFCRLLQLKICLAQMIITYSPSLPLSFSCVNLSHIAASDKLPKVNPIITLRKRSRTSLSHHNQAIHGPGHISLDIVFLVLCFSSKDPPFRILHHNLPSSTARPSAPVIPPEMSSVSSLIICPNMAVE